MSEVLPYRALLSLAVSLFALFILLVFLQPVWVAAAVAEGGLGGGDVTFA